METSKEMKLKVIDKMRKNIEDGVHMMSGIEYEVTGKWYEVRNSLAHVFNMNVMKYRLKPETITINGVDIPKSLGSDEILEDEVYYHVDNSEFLYEARHGEFIADHGIRFVYETKEEAIEASKLLFGIKQ